VGGRLADPRAIRAPILAVLDPRSRIVPPAAVVARTHTSSSDVQFLRYAGDSGVMMQHVGVLVGANAHEYLWPKIIGWIRGTLKGRDPGLLREVGRISVRRQTKRQTLIKAVDKYYRRHAQEHCAAH
jgi:hypothetical protein